MHYQILALLGLTPFFYTKILGCRQYLKTYFFNIFKSNSHISLDFVLFASMKVLLKMMKNLIFKALFVLTIVKFLSWQFSHVGKQLGKKAKVNFNIYDIINWFASNYNAHTLLNILRGKGNQTMKFGQLIE